MIPLPPWEPDKGPFSATSTDGGKNALPIANGWGPFPDLLAVAASLGEQAFGCWHVRTSSGDYRIIAGTRTALKRYDTATETWTDISGTGAPFEVPLGDLWQAAQFGPTFIVTNLRDGPQAYDVDAGGNFAPLAGNPPKAKFICVAADFVLLGYLRVGLTDFPADLWWSGLNDAAHWTVGRKSSDRQTLPDGEEIVGCIPFVGGARVIQRTARRAVTFTGGPFVFQIQVIDSAKGAVAPYGIIPIPGGDYVFVDESGFYRGDAGLPIGAQRVDAFFLGDVDQDRIVEVQGVSDPFNKVAIWRYPDGAGTWKLIGWDWELDRWFRSDIQTTLLIAIATPGVTLEQLDDYGTLETLSVSLDSRAWKGGRPTVGAFDTTNTMGFFAGAHLEAVLETSSTELNPGTRAFVRGAYAIGNATGYTLAAAGSAYHGAGEAFGAAVSASTRTGTAPLRSDARLHRFRVTVAAAHDWTHLHGVRPDFRSSGRA